MNTTAFLDAKDYLKIALFVIAFALFAFFASRFPDESEEPPYERVKTNIGILLDEFPEEALDTLEAYVYQYTGDYNNVPQHKADSAYDEIREFCYELYGVLD